MKGDDNPSVVRAKMVALLALLDVLSDQAQMSTVAIDRVGNATGGQYAGKVRLKFTVFGDDARLLKLATEVTQYEVNEALLAMLTSAANIEDKIRFALDRIDAWTELVRRLLAGARLTPGDTAALPPPRL